MHFDMLQLLSLKAQESFKEANRLMQTHVMSVASITQIFAESFLKGLLAAKYCKQGFKTLKIEMGRDLNADIEVIQAVRAAHPHCLFIFNANKGYTLKKA